MVDWNVVVTAFSFGIGILIGYMIGYVKGVFKRESVKVEG